MSKRKYEYWFKGDNLYNLYRIDAILTSRSPLHIGTGNIRFNSNLLKDSTVGEKPPEIADIERDYRKLPYIPGSALRGVIRNYLFQIFCSFGGKIAKDPEYDKEEKFRDMNQEEQIKYMQLKGSLLEQLFGTPFCESKIEFWDASIAESIISAQYKNKGFDQERLSYVVHSVSIDPFTGAAAPNKLYSFDVAPPGLKYNLTIVGRNLTDEELGFLLIGLEGFNSPIYPLCVGAMSGRGFGRMNLEISGIYRLTKDDFPNWLSLASSSDDAGYKILHSLSLKMDEQHAAINKFKSTFMSWFKENK